MSLDPYRTLPQLDQALSSRLPRAPLDVAVVIGLAWTLAAVRVLAALARADATSRELGLAWLVVLVAPYLIWREIAASRRA
jgi:hypothetical protein